MKQKPQNYINNREFYEEIIKYYELNTKHQTEHNTIENLPLSNKIGNALLLIATNLSRSNKYSGYTWKEDMIGDALIYMVKYFHKFNYEKYNNPFAYFTMIAANAFIKRIKYENKKLKDLSKYKQETHNIYYTDENDYNDYGYIDNVCKSINQNFIKPDDIIEENKKIKKQSELDKFLEV